MSTPPKPLGFFIQMPPNGCSGNCDQGRRCDCSADPPIRSVWLDRIFAVALGLIFAAAIAAHFGVLVP